MYEKDFDGWNIIKQEIDNYNFDLYYHEREVWFCRLGINLGFEQDGKGDDFLRPVLILNILNNNIFLGVPLTSTIRSGSFFYNLDLNGLESSVILAQVRSYDAKRLKYKIGCIDQSQYVSIKKKLIKLL